MEINELRIGNHIEYCGYIAKVDGIDDRISAINIENKDHIFDKPSYFDPIELTEEVLLKIGFKKEERISSILYYLDYEINGDEYFHVRYVIYNSKALPLLRITSPSPIISESYELTKRGIKYLHQLQNAYYCLTNNELEIEL